MPQLVEGQTALLAKKSDSSADAEQVGLLLFALNFRANAVQSASLGFCGLVHAIEKQYDRTAKFLKPEISRLFIRKNNARALAAPADWIHQQPREIEKEKDND
ncbi:hypothetical protein [Brevibacterium pigmentatum]|uniref:hypothetical protein n=1 Tax=Brevibacterium pigmentatum TaxID=1496080 RepID=UPI001421A9F1|nr:hypothetical protein [Brevibacterium pigmentatum]